MSAEKITPIPASAVASSTSATRLLTVRHLNQPGVLAHVFYTLGQARINVEGFDTNGYDANLNPAPYALADFFNQTGTEDEVCEGIERLGEAGVKCIASATYTIIDKKAHLRAVGEGIIPRFRD